MDIDLSDLPVPKYKSKKKISLRKDNRKPSTLKTIKYMDHLFDVQFLKTYFDIKNKNKTITPPPSLH